MERTDLQPHIRPTASYCPLAFHACPSPAARDGTGLGMGAGALRRARRSVRVQPAQAGRSGCPAGTFAAGLQWSPASRLWLHAEFAAGAEAGAVSAWAWA